MGDDRYEYVHDLTNDDAAERIYHNNDIYTFCLDRATSGDTHISPYYRTSESTVDTDDW